MRSEWQFAKTTVTARHAAIVTHHDLATDAGYQMLHKGGNAIDAAVAAAFVMSVVEPFMSGIGGGAYMVVHLAGEKKTVVLDCSFRAPQSATAEMYAQELADLPQPPDASGLGVYTLRGVKLGVNAEGPRAVGVPGVVAGLCEAAEQWGTMPLKQLMAPAIQLAQHGFPINWFLAIMIYNRMESLRNWPPAAKVFLDGERTYRAGELGEPAQLLVQADLADTLLQIAHEGAAAFYQGPIARRLVAEVQTHGGLLSLADLEKYSARLIDPLYGEYRDIRIAAMPQVSGGPTIVQTLNLLESFDTCTMDVLSADRLHLFAECARRAFVDRYVFSADPQFACVPYDGLLSKEYARERAREIRMQQATPLVKAGDPWRFDPLDDSGLRSGRAMDGNGETTHISVVDEERNLVSYTQTSAQFMVEGTGVLLNGGMNWFDPEPERPNSIAGWKRSLCNMTPLILLRGDRPFVALGSPGGRRIQNALSLVIANLVDHGMSLQDAITTPRVDCSTPKLLVDARIPASVRGELQLRGHRVQDCRDTLEFMSFARPNGILIDEEQGCLHADSYPYFHGVARGF